MSISDANAPNLLFVFADQMRGCDLSCAGNAQIQTPNLERLAREGVYCPLAFANAPVCGPSRAILMTGRYPISNRVVANDLPLPTEMATFGTQTQIAGYRTGYIGKWHLDGVPRDKWTPPGARRFGFDFWAVANCSHTYFDGYLYRDTPQKIALEGYEPERQTDFAVEFLRQSPDDTRPFCLFLSWGPPHDPYEQVPERFQALYAPENIALRPNVQPLQNALIDGAARLGPQRALALSYSAISALDAQIGRLLDELERLGLAENTIVVFASDHGDMLFSHGLLKKQAPYEESVRIPLIARWPAGLPRSAQCETPISIVDFLPTFLSLMQLPIPDAVQGRDLSRALCGEAQDEQDEDAILMMEMISAGEGLKQNVGEWRALRTRRHTYARRSDGTPWLLFDNLNDPFQLDNLLHSPAAAALQRALDAQLDQRLQSCGDAGLPWQQLLRALNLGEIWNQKESLMHEKATLPDVD